MYVVCVVCAVYVCSMCGMCSICVYYVCVCAVHVCGVVCVFLYICLFVGYGTRKGLMRAKEILREVKIPQFPRPVWLGPRNLSGEV